MNRYLNMRGMFPNIPSRGAGGVALWLACSEGEGASSLLDSMGSERFGRRAASLATYCRAGVLYSQVDERWQIRRQEIEETVRDICTCQNNISMLEAC